MAVFLHVTKVVHSSHITLLKISIATCIYLSIYLLACVRNLVLNLRSSRAAVERSSEHVWYQLQAVDLTAINRSKRA